MKIKQCNRNPYFMADFAYDGEFSDGNKFYLRIPEKDVEEFATKLTQYLKEIAFKDTYVSTARLGNLLLDTAGVFDYSDFKVNGAMNNVNLLDTDVPKVGTISFSYVEVV